MSVQSLGTPNPFAPGTMARPKGDVRTRILRQGTRLFGRHGFDAASVAMIAEAAGISQGLLYRYFDGKEALLRDILDDGLAALPTTGTAGDAAAALERLVRALLENVRARLDFWRCLYAVRMRLPQLGAPATTLSRWTAGLRRDLAATLAALGARDPEVEGELLFAALDGVAQHYVMEPNRYPLDAVASRLLERYIRGATTATEDHPT